MKGTRTGLNVTSGKLNSIDLFVRDALSQAAAWNRSICATCVTRVNNVTKMWYGRPYAFRVPKGRITEELLPLSWTVLQKFTV